MERRAFLLSSMMLALTAGRGEASPIDPAQTFTLQRDQIKFGPWDGLPPGSGEMAKLYGDLDKPGPYLVLMKWNPGWFSAPHSYATDRIQIVLSGTWWANSGGDFDPKNAVPVAAGGFVKRVCPHGAAFEDEGGAVIIHSCSKATAGNNCAGRLSGWLRAHVPTRESGYPASRHTADHSSCLHERFEECESEKPLGDCHSGEEEEEAGCKPEFEAKVLLQSQALETARS